MDNWKGVQGGGGCVLASLFARQRVKTHCKRLVTRRNRTAAFGIRIAIHRRQIFAFFVVKAVCLQAYIVHIIG